MIDPLVVAFGLGVGVLIGLTGVGGGSLMTPLLVLLVGVQPVVAVGTDLAYGAITKTVGGWRHLRAGAVDLGVSKWLAVGSVPGAVAGVLAVTALHERYGDGFDSTLLVLVAIALLVVACSALARAVFGEPRDRHSVPMRGNVDLGPMANILAGSLPGVRLGSALLPHVPPRALRLALGCTLLGSAMAVLIKAGVAFPAWTIVAIPALVGLLAFVVHRPRRAEAETA